MSVLIWTFYLCWQTSVWLNQCLNVGQWSDKKSNQPVYAALGSFLIADVVLARLPVGKDLTLVKISLFLAFASDFLTASHNHKTLESNQMLKEQKRCFLPNDQMTQNHILWPAEHGTCLNTLQEIHTNTSHLYIVHIWKRKLGKHDYVVYHHHQKYKPDVFLKSTKN